MKNDDVLEMESEYKDGYKKDENYFVSIIRPELNRICANPVRACIIHMLVQNKDLNHTIQVEEIAKRLGKRHSVIIYHLERLMDWRITKVARPIKYGEGEKRSIWGLNLDYPTLVREVYSRTLKLFYTQKQLDKMCSINKNVRKNSSEKNISG